MYVKIIGAGSIGNHLAQAARRMGWDVCVTDKDPKALLRMREEIYPARYGEWDNAILLNEEGKEPKIEFDIIMVGTPPDVRMQLALDALAERPRALLLEKPLCAPNDPLLGKFMQMQRRSDTICVVGYDHAVSPSVTHVIELLRKGAIGRVATLDVEFREHWAGIFRAHPWLSGPQDSYLGFRSRGGGASGEHSHALHLWLVLSQAAGFGRPTHFSVVTANGKTPGTDYDEIASFTLVTQAGIGRVVQDVVTDPPRKWARIQGSDGSIEWNCNVPGKGDVVTVTDCGGVSENVFPKKRPDDFYAEMQHVDALLNGRAPSSDSPISIENGKLVMDILSRAYCGDSLLNL